MLNYRRCRVAGGTFFFTVNLLDRRKGLHVDHVAALRRIVLDVKTDLPFEPLAKLPALAVAKGSDHGVS